ncbi:MAG: class I SAM-dependent methyltransferase [Parcubacteria group bacterium]|nr:class I SAM-dependent methyltransferase [Parcubacteria group bacterium]
MLNSKIRVFKYLLWRNDKVWEWLNDEEKAFILEANKLHNTLREDYANPEQYGAKRVIGGENWRSSEDRRDFKCGVIIDEALESIKPKTILELGPGAGFYTKHICEKDYVKQYVGVDIGKAFLDYLEPHLRALSKNKPDFSFRLACDDFNNLDYQNHFDLVIFLSTVHHIPNRIELFGKMSQFLKKGGAVLCVEPANYLPRKISLIKRLPRYLKKSFYSKRMNLSTHHMCTFGEFKKICRKTGLRIDKKWCILPKKLFNKKIIKRCSILRFFSAAIGVLFKKP